MDPLLCTRSPSDRSGLEVLACSFDTDPNYYNFIPAKSFFIAIVILRVVFCVCIDRKISKSRGLNRLIAKFSLGFAPLAPTSTHQVPSCNEHAFCMLKRPSTFAFKTPRNFSVFSIKIEWHVCV